MHIYTHNYMYYTYYHIFYMKIPHKCGLIRVNFLQAVRLQVTHTHFEFVGVLSPKVDPHKTFMDKNHEMRKLNKVNLINGITV